MNITIIIEKSKELLKQILGNKIYSLLSVLVITYGASWWTFEPLSNLIGSISVSHLNLWLYYSLGLIILLYIFSPRTKSFSQFLQSINFDKITYIEILCHTGRHTCDDVLKHLNENSIKNKLYLRILLRDPTTETTKRKNNIEATVTDIQNFNQNNNIKIYIKYYASLPWLRYIKTSNEEYFINHYYYFRGSKTISYPDEEITLLSNRLKKVSNSWFKYYWGKSPTDELNIHSIIFDFDDTITKSYEIQIDSWCYVIENILNKSILNVPIYKINKDYIENETTANKKSVTETFFQMQNAIDICNAIFSNLDEKEMGLIQTARRILRKRKFEQAGDTLLYENVKEVIVDLSKRYYLSIISSTDSEFIRSFLAKIVIKDDEYKTLDSYFEHIIGINDEVSKMDRLSDKANRLIKISQILGMPSSRLLYIGDSFEDFEACRQTNINFIEAKLNKALVESATGKDSLIEPIHQGNRIENWIELSSKISKIEKSNAN